MLLRSKQSLVFTSTMKKLSIKPESFFRVLAETKRSQVAEMVLEPGKSTGGSENVHKESDQWLYIVDGNGKAIIEGKEVKLKTGDLILIEKGETHEIINEGKALLRTFSIYAPPAY